ncbi:transposase [Levilactobacillus tujiorum]
MSCNFWRLLSARISHKFPDCSVTNLTTPTIDSLFNIYHQRGVVENYIKEIKEGFFLDKTNSHSYLVNTFHMLISGIAYNLVQAMKPAVLPLVERKHGIMTLRFKLLHIPARIVSHARKTWIQLSSANVFDRLFWHVLHRIQQM